MQSHTTVHLENRQFLHADMQLSSRSIDCWSSHIVSAMTGLIQDYMFKEKLRNCEPIDLAQSFCCGSQREILGVLDTGTLF
jgi:hypothetical protein